MQKHPLNAPGKYYVDQEICFLCDVCGALAAENFRGGLAGSDFGAYVFKQPESPNEEMECEKAAKSCPHEAIQCDGID